VHFTCVGCSNSIALFEALSARHNTVPAQAAACAACAGRELSTDMCAAAAAVNAVVVAVCSCRKHWSCWMRCSRLVSSLHPQPTLTMRSSEPAGEHC
jgi:hypothetical protein